MGMVLAGTGHRPHKLYKAYEKEGLEILIAVANEQLAQICPKRVISGMALGWDQALAIAAIRLNIPLIAAVPFEGQESKWPPSSQRLFYRILNRADEIKIVSEGKYSPAKMQIRNIYMCDNADVILALWNGTNGGTKNCVDYAIKKQKILVNCWHEYSALIPEEN